jgi:hypothetical protein
MVMGGNMSDLIKEARKFHITEDMDCHTERLIHKMADTIEQLEAFVFKVSSMTTLQKSHNEEARRLLGTPPVNLTLTLEDKT